MAVHVAVFQARSLVSVTCGALLEGGDGLWPTRSPLVQVGRQPDEGSLS
jgi:hypothetical protein